MRPLLQPLLDHPKTTLAALAAALLAGLLGLRGLPVDIFPDIQPPRLVLQTEAPGLTAAETEQRVTRILETAAYGIGRIRTIRSSSTIGLSIITIDLDWRENLDRARTRLYERLARLQTDLPPEAKPEIAPPLAATGEIQLIALTPATDTNLLDLRELAEYDLRPQLLAIPGVGEVAVMGGSLPEYRINASPLHLSTLGIHPSQLADTLRAALSRPVAGYLPDDRSEEIPLEQTARVETLEALRDLPLNPSLRLRQAADVTLSGSPRRGSASLDSAEAVVLSVQKTPGGNTLELTREIDAVLASFAARNAAKLNLEPAAYRQADFIETSLRGVRGILRDTLWIVLVVLVLTLLKWRSILVVLATLFLTILAGISLFPALGIGVDVMTLGGVAVAAGDIVDSGIVFAEAIRRKVDEGGYLSRREAVLDAMAGVFPSVLCSVAIIVLAFVPLFLLPGLEGRLFRPLGKAYLAFLGASFGVAVLVVPCLSLLLEGGSGGGVSRGSVPLMRLLDRLYVPCLEWSIRHPILTLIPVLLLAVWSASLAAKLGTSFLPPLHEPTLNVLLSLSPSASLPEAERTARHAGRVLSAIPGVGKVVRRTGRAERDQHAEPVSSSEFIVHLDGNASAVRQAIRERLGSIPGAVVMVGYPIEHRISAILSGVEAELAVNLYCEDPNRLRAAVRAVEPIIASVPGIAGVRANREASGRTLRIDYDPQALAAEGMNLGDAGVQISAAHRGVPVGTILANQSRREVVIRLADDSSQTERDLRRFTFIGGRGQPVPFPSVATLRAGQAPLMLLRENGRRKALISCNLDSGADIGQLVQTLRQRLQPIVQSLGCDFTLAGSHEARQSAARTLLLASAALLALILALLTLSLGRLRHALLALVNLPLALIGGVLAARLAGASLSVSALVGFVTVTGFALRNGLLLLNALLQRLAHGQPLPIALREGARERLAPILMTTLTTLLGLIPLMLSTGTPGAELLAPLATIQFGGILGALLLNQIALPALVMLTERKPKVPTTALLACLALALAGCTAYRPAQLDFQRHSDQWRPARITLQTPALAARIALIGNPELNLARTKLAHARKATQASGYWADPDLSFDLLRIAQPATHPFLFGAGIDLTLPISGTPSLERRARELYTQAERLALQSAELSTSNAAVRAWLRLKGIRRRREAVVAYLGSGRLASLLSAVDHLAQAGELAKGAAASVRLRHHDRQHLAHELREQEAEAAADLKRLLGFHPDSEIALGEGIPALPQGPLELPPALDFVRHPEVLAALGRLGASEAELRLEVRRQYPEVSLSPLYEREDGSDRLGFGVGVSLPIWNRNRLAIAEATGRREVSLEEVVICWKRRVAEATRVAGKVSRLLTHRPAAEVLDPWELYRAGEVDAVGCFELGETRLEGVLSELSWSESLLDAAAELGYACWLEEVER
ncbi:MAG: efflux RND transporter permease subunit [Kiritimatiellia bacterium]